MQESLPLQSASTIRERTLGSNFSSMCTGVH